MPRLKRDVACEPLCRRECEDFAVHWVRCASAGDGPDWSPHGLIPGPRPIGLPILEV